MQRFHFCIFLQLVVRTSEEDTVWYLAREPVVIFKKMERALPVLPHRSNLCVVDICTHVLQHMKGR